MSSSEHGPTRAERLRLALDRELTDDEEVIWHGWQLARIEPRQFGIYVFAVPWTAFSVMWTVLAAGAMGASGVGALGLAFPLFGLPFIVIGGAMLLKPFMPLIERDRVLFVMTDRRAIKLTLLRQLTVKSVPADRMGLAEKQELRDGTGTLNLAVHVGRDSDGDRQTEFFAIGPVADIAGAAAAAAQISLRPREMARSQSLSS